MKTTQEKLQICINCGGKTRIEKISDKEYLHICVFPRVHFCPDRNRKTKGKHIIGIKKQYKQK